MAARSGEGPLRVPFTNPEKVLFPPHAGRRAYTKIDVAAYYHAVAPVLLPLLSGRPMVLRRFPHGIRGEGFFHKDYSQEAPPFVRKVPIWSGHRGESHEYVTVENEETLLWMVQLGCIEMHPWLSRVAADPAACADPRGIEGAGCGLDFPDTLAFDCDPYVRQGRLGRRGTEAGGEPGIAREDFEKAVEVALVLRDALRGLGLEGFAKTSGKRGVHVIVPLAPRYRYDAVRAFARTLAGHVAARHRALITTAYRSDLRAGKVFLDVNQNVRGKTLAAPWSLRPTPQASVSLPVEWEELADLDPAAHRLDTVPDRLRARGDPWRMRPQDLGKLL